MSGQCSKSCLVYEPESTFEFQRVFFGDGKTWPCMGPLVEVIHNQRSRPTPGHVRLFDTINQASADTLPILHLGLTDISD